jgi:hypothetical protein
MSFAILETFLAAVEYMVYAPIKPLLPEGEQRVVFKNSTWQGYQQLLEVFGDRRAARITFDRGALEITMPLEEHGFSGRLIEMLNFGDIMAKNGISISFKKMLLKKTFM